MKHNPTHLLLVPLLVAALVLAPALQAGAAWGEFTIADEVEAGRKFDAYVRSSMPLVEDTEVAGYVEGLVKRLVDHIPPQPFRFTTTVIQNGAMNAFAIPGGYVYVFTGLILNLQTEDQLASVLAHEIAHVTEHHVAKRMAEMKLASIGAIAGTLAGAFLGIAGGGSNMANLGGALMMGSQAGAAAAYLQYTQENEREADHQGLNYLAAAGYNPMAMAETFDIMQKQRWYVTNDKIPSYLSTHPALPDRVAYIKGRVARMPQDLLLRKADNTAFLRVQTLVRGKLQSPDVALAWYNNKGDLTPLDTMGLGLVQTRLNRTADAERSFQKALAAVPNDSLVLREAGIYYFKQGNFQKSQPLLQKALILKPGDALTLFYNARLLGESGQYDAAVLSMRQVLKQLPEDPEVRYHMGRLLGESGDQFGGHLNLAYCYELQHNKKQADFHLEKARSLARDADQKKQVDDFENFRREREELRT
jgi:predicted Zn-dependent protease